MTASPELRLLAQGALALFVLGFLTRDELKLRALVTMGCVLLVTFNGLYPGGPLWTPIVHNSVIGAINIALLMLVVRERSTIGMGQATLDIYRTFTTFNPGQFRQLMRISQTRPFDTEATLCTVGRRPEALYLVVAGEVRVVSLRESVRLLKEDPATIEAEAHSFGDITR